ncbi:glycosyltransferase family 4 protein [Flexivirga sp. ID2601S]|uniref:Glycosyltransferase family 4 protein n=1 Tax=Flexivirga aerilata TaxID=1656889 RepID=A0A849AP28_9MICO|nr:glycosyltransferase family 4 protein [Flexivirga aerilata]
MRIVHVVTSGRFAGVEQYVARLATGQVALGHEVVVVGGAAEIMAPRLAEGRAGFVAAGSIVDSWRVLRALPRPDVVGAHMTASETAALLPRSPALVPVVATRHFARRRGQSSARSLVLRGMDRLLAAQIAVSAYVAAHIGVAAQVVHPGVDARPDHPHPTGRRLLVMQRFEAEKETGVAIRAFAASGLREQGWCLDVAGDGAEGPALRRLVAELGVSDAVRFLGFRLDGPELMRGSSALLAPSRLEAFGLTVLEAMASGLPVIAADGGAHRETVGSVTPELLFAPGDHRAAAALLAGLARDRARREEVGRALRLAQRARFTTEHMARRVSEIYAGVA